ncbi:MAG: helix-turn-helix domain-containing protein [Gemmatimonadaceae bacterium]
MFADLGFAPEEAENLKVRSDLMIALRRAIDGMTQIEAAALLGVSQPRVSELRRGHIDKFTIDTLVNMLARTGVETRISLRKVRQPAA